MNDRPDGHERLPFFVYGTLRPGEANHAWALRGRTAAEQPATVQGALLYDGPGYPYAVRGPADAAVHGHLVTPAEDVYDEVLAVLDRLEGYTPGAPHNDYDRVRCAAVLPDGTSVPAWVYLAAEPLAGRLRAAGTPIPGGDWLATDRRAAGPVGPGVAANEGRAFAAATATATVQEGL
ncbi:gamma-glutamylcyclotransferase family protein [Streptomyces niger]|uniref:gamma-glutamylcyclotransferase family protein n=1 Tax=Streptomyces niger TaxID=66373 RepID=UPI000AD09F09|nr:gamma-glutamylcyclotransferase family protein [Streptomyces niger]